MGNWLYSQTFWFSNRTLVSNKKQNKNQDTACQLLQLNEVKKGKQTGNANSGNTGDIKHQEQLLEKAAIELYAGYVFMNSKEVVPMSNFWRDV